MQRNCDYCGAPYEAKTKASRFCKAAHRVSYSQRGKPKASVTQLQTTAKLDQDLAQDDPPEPSSDDLMPPLVSAVAAELMAADRFHTSLGQQAFHLATRIVTAKFDTGASIASMHARLADFMEKALDGVKVADDPLDELKRRRDAKLAGS